MLLVVNQNIEMPVGALSTLQEAFPTMICWLFSRKYIKHVNQTFLSVKEKQDSPGHIHTYHGSLKSG